MSKKIEQLTAKIEQATGALKAELLLELCQALPADALEQRVEAARQALDLAEHLNAPEADAPDISIRILHQNSYKTLAELYAASGDYRQAYAYCLKYAQIQDSILNEESQKKLAELRVRYETAQKELEAEIYRLKNAELAKANRKLKDASEKMNRLARTDSLTQLPNRREVRDQIEHEIIRFERSGKPFVILIADIDDFKVFNDRYGHDCGDFVLVTVAREMRSMLRKQDCVGRWGGEEFVIILPETNMKGARVIAEKIRSTFVERTYRYQNDIELSIRMTIGGSVYLPKMSIDDCLKRADEALYEGKMNGKNQVVMAEV